MDLRASVVAALDRLIASGEIEKRIEELLAKSIGEVLAGEMRSYSDFGKQITEAVKKSLAVHGDLDLPSYNDAILKIVRTQLAARTEAVIQQQVAEQLQELLDPAPASITLTELVEKYIKRVKDIELGGCVCYGEAHKITLVVDESDTLVTYIGLDDEANKPLRRCDIQIGVWKRDRRVWTLRFGSEDVGKELFSGPLYGIEKMLFQMKAAGSKLIINAATEDIETSY